MAKEPKPFVHTMIMGAMGKGYADGRMMAFKENPTEKNADEILKHAKIGLMELVAKYGGKKAKSAKPEKQSKKDTKPEKNGKDKSKPKDKTKSNVLPKKGKNKIKMARASGDKKVKR